MKVRLFSVIMLGALCTLAQAQQKPPAGRAGLDPASRNKVASVLARNQMGEADAQAAVEREMVTGPSGKSCNTNVGTAPKINEGTSGIGSRYGAGNSDQVTVVRGSVINICK